jgi:hypothetical protein
MPEPGNWWLCRAALSPKGQNLAIKKKKERRKKRGEEKKRRNRSTPENQVHEGNSKCMKGACPHVAFLPLLFGHQGGSMEGAACLGRAVG